MLGVGISGGFAGCLGLRNTGGRARARSPPASDFEKFSLDHFAYDDGWSRGVAGTVKNISGEDISYARVEVSFLDTNSNEVSSGSTFGFSLGVDEQKEFDVPFGGSDWNIIAEYTIRAVTHMPGSDIIG